jgi:hypothetical protein
MVIKPTTLSELIFEPRDTEIFRIPDTKTRIATVQNYFFPRLELLLRHTLDLIQEIYKVNPYERMTFVYRPSNRRTARQNYDFDDVHIGLSGKRRTNRPLTIKRADGKPFFFHPTYLTYKIDLQGSLCVELLPFRQNVDSEYISAVASLVQQNLKAIAPILQMNHISHSSAMAFIDIEEAFALRRIQENGIVLFSPTQYFPVSANRGLSEAMMAFIALYPLLDSFVSLGEGEPPRLVELLDNLKNWFLTTEVDEESDAFNADPVEFNSMPELDSYSFVRAGLWWSVLARDNWTCCSCGRSPKEQGIALEVDHIKPRSKGGTDDLSNLQTLCKKCNVGKSNRDNTDLRRHTEKATGDRRA